MSGARAGVRIGKLLATCLCVGSFILSSAECYFTVRTLVLDWLLSADYHYHPHALARLGVTVAGGSRLKVRVTVRGVCFI